jgi:hypothetical protein
VIVVGVGTVLTHPIQDIAMTTLRHRMTFAALTLLTASLAACASEPTDPLGVTGRQRLSADVDTSGRRPTIPWASVEDTTNRRPTIPWASVEDTTNRRPTIPWAKVSQVAPASSTY